MQSSDSLLPAPCSMLNSVNVIRHLIAGNGKLHSTVIHLAARGCGIASVLIERRTEDHDKSLAFAKRLLEEDERIRVRAEP